MAKVATLNLSPRVVGGILGAVVMALLLGHLAFAVGNAATGHPLYLLPRLFDMGIEGNLPTFFSSLNLLLASGLLAVISTAERSRGGTWTWAWVGLAVGFALMSVDEGSQIHDGLIGPLLRHVITEDERGWHFAWYFVYAPLVLILFAIYVPFLRSLPGRFRYLFLASGLLFVGGAVGVEIFEASLVGSGATNVAILLSKSVEETAEMAGVVLFNYALLDYLRSKGFRAAVKFDLPTR